jgi:glycosyltransferase involved in cell wall biosynthesis
VIVDDGSDDDTVASVNSLNDDRISLIMHEENKGQAAAENTGIKASNGEYIAFLDSDVEWLPQKIEKQVSALESTDSNVAAVYCSHYNSYHDYLREVKVNYSTGNIFHELLDGSVGFATSTLLIERSCLSRVGLWDASLDSNIDFDLCLRIAQQYQFECITEPLLISHDYTGSRITTNKTAKLNGLEQIITKWGAQMEARFGSGYTERFRKQYLTGVYRDIALWHARNGRRQKAICEFWNYLEQSDSVNAKFTLIFAFSFVSVTLYEFIKYIWFRITGNSRAEVIKA